MRIDKYLWAVRLYKTREQAVQACKRNKVLVNEVQVKPSKQINVNDIIKIKKLPIWQTFKVLQLLKNRIPAKLVDVYLREITPQEEIAKLELMKLVNVGYRDRGAGRPTKKQRREIDKFKQKFT